MILGIDNVICGMANIPFVGPKGEEFKEKAGFDEGWEFGMAVLVGYGKTTNKPHLPDKSKIYYIE